MSDILMEQIRDLEAQLKRSRDHVDAMTEAYLDKSTRVGQLSEQIRKTEEAASVALAKADTLISQLANRIDVMIEGWQCDLRCWGDESRISIETYEKKMTLVEEFRVKRVGESEVSGV